MYVPAIQRKAGGHEPVVAENSVLEQTRMEFLTTTGLDEVDSTRVPIGSNRFTFPML